MKIITTDIPDVLIIEPKVFNDGRGFFYESYNKRTVKDEVGLDFDFVQDNHSRSMQGVLRGLHYQIRQAQGKLVRVLFGEVFDVAVDIRKSSPTYGEHVAVHLTADDKRMLWVPPGFAHGYQVLSEVAEFMYKTTDYYAPEYERCILWNDPDLDIQWPLSGQPILSDKDKNGTLISNAEVYD